MEVVFTISKKLQTSQLLADVRVNSSGLLVSLYSAGLVPIQHTVDILCKQGRLMLIYAASNFTVVDTS